MAGIRDSKTVDGVTYNYLTLDGKVVRQTWGSNVLDIIYDNSGLPYAFKYNNAYYIYVLNQQGDVIRIVNSTGATVAEYRYDAWGNVIYSNGSMAAVNPIRYRGYYYDTETGFYYLQSRYYDPSIGRFINADSFASTGQGFLGYNMFAYCNNNPVSNSDPSGHWLVEAIAAVAIVTGLLLSGCSANQYGAAKRYKETSSPNFNCYAYALRETEWRYVGGYPEAVTDYNVENVAAMVMDDVKASGRSIRPLESFDSPIEQNEYRIALRTGVKDYHFMIQHSDGSWSHKPSWLPSRLADGNNPSDMSWDMPYFDTNKYGLLQLMYHENYYDSATLYFAISP